MLRAGILHVGHDFLFHIQGVGHDHHRARLDDAPKGHHGLRQVGHHQSDPLAGFNAHGNRTWQYTSSDIKKLKDDSIKALFLVNPSNPPSVAMKEESVKILKKVVNEYNPDLMIISDDVYSTFVDGFRSLMADLPFNTLGVYSFSKYFGVTGWRLGTVALYENNVFDEILGKQDEGKKERARIRYSGISTDTEKIKFVDRIVADSRQVALNHTAGLSTPQQVQMAFLAVFAIVDEKNKYKNLTRNICRRRKKLLFDGLGIGITEDKYSASYYAQFDLIEWASQNYSDRFATYLKNNYRTIDILIKLAEQSSIVLLDGNGFNGPEWSVRISLANLCDESYSKIGKALHNVMDSYVELWKNRRDNN